MLDFSMYQSGIDFNKSLFKPSVKSLNPLNRLTQSLFWRSIGS
jgi:hypothetical protein